MRTHDGDRRRPGTIQIDENVACVSVAGEGLHVDVASLAVAGAQKPDSGRATQLLRGPQPLARKCLPRLLVNQSNQVQLAGHGGELPANGLQSEKETAVVHDRNFGVEPNRRTMNFQRTANCVLSVYLSRGGRFNVAAERLIYELEIASRSAAGQVYVLLRGVRKDFSAGSGGNQEI